MHKIIVMFTCFMNAYNLWNCVAISISRDHKPDQIDERQRIENARGFVMWAGKVSGNSFWKL